MKFESSQRSQIQKTRLRQLKRVFVFVASYSFLCQRLQLAFQPVCCRPLTTALM